MCNLRWLELNRTNVSRLPEYVGKLKSLVCILTSIREFRSLLNEKKTYSFLGKIEFIA